VKGQWVVNNKIISR